MKVLIIDDSPFMRTMFKGLLRQFQLTDVIEAGNGHEGLKLLTNNEVKLILLDLHMPVMDGITFLNEINKNPDLTHIPIILVSSDKEASLVNDALKLGACSYISKPFRIEGLKSALEVAFPEWI